MFGHLRAYKWVVSTDRIIGNEYHEPPSTVYVVQGRTFTFRVVGDRVLDILDVGLG